MNFSKKDEEYMDLALEEAQKAYEKGNLPIGAVLVVNGKVYKSQNSSVVNKDFVSHAESDLIRKHSHSIRNKYTRGENINIELYTTLEPCLMCLGTALLNKVTRIVYSLEDPIGGGTSVDKDSLKSLYVKWWPKIEGGLNRDKTAELMLKFIDETDNPFWKKWKKKI